MFRMHGQEYANTLCRRIKKGYQRFYLIYTKHYEKKIYLYRMRVHL